MMTPAEIDMYPARCSATTATRRRWKRRPDGSPPDSFDRLIAALQPKPAAQPKTARPVNADGCADDLALTR